MPSATLKIVVRVRWWLRPYVWLLTILVRSGILTREEALTSARRAVTRAVVIGKDGNGPTG